VERKNVELPSVDSKLLDNGVGYIQVSEFQTNTASQFEDALDGLTNQGMKGLIVDLRANPGGLLTAVTEMVDRLLPAETVGKLLQELSCIQRIKTEMSRHLVMMMENRLTVLS